MQTTVQSVYYYKQHIRQKTPNEYYCHLNTFLPRGSCLIMVSLHCQTSYGVAGRRQLATRLPRNVILNCTSICILYVVTLPNKIFFFFFARFTRHLFQLGVLDLSEVDVILISNHHCMLALPYITEFTNFAGVVYATEPTLHIGRSVVLVPVPELDVPALEAYF